MNKLQISKGSLIYSLTHDNRVIYKQPTTTSQTYKATKSNRFLHILRKKKGSHF
jgi:hypothetical protein